MATLSQLNDQKQKLQDQIDQLTTQVNTIETQQINIRKQLETITDPNQKASLSKQLADLDTKKGLLTGVATVEEDITPSTTTTAGNISSINGQGNYPMRIGVPQDKNNINSFIKKKTAVDNFLSSRWKI